MRPQGIELRAAPVALDLEVLKRVVDEPGVRDRARGEAMVARLWAACGVPDFRKSGLDPHARFVARLFGHLSEGDGHIPQHWFAEEVARLDRVEGDVETLAGRIAGVRTWAYIANRADWLADPAAGAARAGAVEERLSDALHASLTQRFVDRRTSVLMRQIGSDLAALPVTIGEQGDVSVEDHAIGRLDGFRFTPDAGARASDKRILLAAAERRLGGELARRAKELSGGRRRGADARRRNARSCGVATPSRRLGTGPNLVQPKLALDRAVERAAAAAADRGHRADRPVRRRYAGEAYARHWSRSPRCRARSRRAAAPRGGRGAAGCGRHRAAPRAAQRARRAASRGAATAAARGLRRSARSMFSTRGC